MNIPNISTAELISPSELKIEYENGEIRILDIEKYLISDYFKELKDYSYLCKFQIRKNIIYWPNGQDIAPETIYLDSIPQNE